MNRRQRWDAPGKNPDGTPSAAPRPTTPRFPPVLPRFPHVSPPGFPLRFSCFPPSPTRLFSFCPRFPLFPPLFPQCFSVFPGFPPVSPISPPFPPASPPLGTSRPCAGD